MGGSYGVERLALYKCSRKWDRPRQRSPSIHAATNHGPSNRAEFVDNGRLGPDAVGRPGCGPRRPVFRRGDLLAIGLLSGRGARLGMIITRSPLRISLGGGGTDLPSYYRDHTGFLIAAAIDQYVYVTVMRPFSPGIYLKYSQLEHATASTRCSIRSSAKRCSWSASGRRISKSPAGGYPRRNGPWLVGQLHDGAAQRALRAPAAPAASERARRTGV